MREARESGSVSCCDDIRIRRLALTVTALPLCRSAALVCVQEEEELIAEWKPEPLCPPTFKPKEKKRFIVEG